MPRPATPEAKLAEIRQMRALYPDATESYLSELCHVGKYAVRLAQGKEKSKKSETPKLRIGLYVLEDGAFVQI